MPQYLQLSCINPTALCKHLVPFAKFPEWFGKFSSQRKNERLSNELKSTLCGASYSSIESIITEFVPIISQTIMKSLLNDDAEEAVESMHVFNITPDIVKEHLESLLFSDSGFKNVSAATKRKMTVFYNNKYKNSLEKVKKKKSEKNNEKVDPEYQEIEGERSEESEEIETEAKPVIKKKTKNRFN